MEYKDLPPTIAKLSENQADRRKSINSLTGAAERNEIVLVRIGDNYVRVDASHLKAAIASTITLDEVRLKKLYDTHDTLSKVATGLL